MCLYQLIYYILVVANGSHRLGCEIQFLWQEGKVVIQQSQVDITYLQ